MDNNNEYNFQALKDYAMFQRISDYRRLLKPTLIRPVMLIALGILQLPLIAFIVLGHSIVKPETYTFFSIASVLFIGCFVWLAHLSIQARSYNQRILGKIFDQCSERQINILNIKRMDSFNDIVDTAYSIAQEKAQMIQNNESFLNECLEKMKTNNDIFTYYMKEAVYEWKGLIEEQRREKHYQSQEQTIDNVVAAPIEPPLVHNTNA